MSKRSFEAHRYENASKWKKGRYECLRVVGRCKEVMELYRDVEYRVQMKRSLDKKLIQGGRVELGRGLKSSL